MLCPYGTRFFLRARVMYQTFCAQHIRAMHTRNTHTHTHTHTHTRVYAHVTCRVLIPENGKSLSIFHGLFRPKTKSFSNFHGLFTYLVRFVVSCESGIMN